MYSRTADHTYLYTTVIPVLLGDASSAGKAARDIYMRHEITPHWFGRKRHILLGGCCRCHRLPRPLADMSDPLLLQILLDFAREQSGLLVLYPCSSEAEAFVLREKQALESRFVILSLPSTGDPLFPVVLKND